MGERKRAPLSPQAIDTRARYTATPAQTTEKRLKFSDEEWAELQGDANKGVSFRFSDGAFWLPHDVDEELVEALVALDQSGGKAKERLIELCRRRSRAPPVSIYWPVRHTYLYLADALDRYQLKRKRGGRQTPLYDRTDIERRLLAANSDMDNGESLERAAAKWDLSTSTLGNSRSGKRGSTRRMERRRRP